MVTRRGHTDLAPAMSQSLLYLGTSWYFCHQDEQGRYYPPPHVASNPAGKIRVKQITTQKSTLQMCKVLQECKTDEPHLVFSSRESFKEKVIEQGNQGISQKGG